MNKTLLTILALLCIVGSLAKGKDVVWEKPNAICNIFRTGTRFKVNRMELEETSFPVRKIIIQLSQVIDLLSFIRLCGFKVIRLCGI